MSLFNKEKKQQISDTISQQLENEEKKAAAMKSRKSEMTEKGLKCSMETEAFLVFELVKTLNSGGKGYANTSVTNAQMQLQQLTDAGYDLDKLAEIYLRKE